MGYAAGASIGAVYGAIRPILPGVSQPLAAVLLGLGAMAATDAASTALGATDPRTWSPQDWASDVLPHLAYGWGAAATYDALAGR
jgi:hypothetical protein